MEHPATALSRILYRSEVFARFARPGISLYPLALPTTHPAGWQTLWQHWLAPFPLALHGHVTFAPDYAGLRVGRTADGYNIIHQYMAHRAQANDIVFGVQAAQQAFLKLSPNFVVLGHSQGGGAAWAVVQRQAQKPVKGYLGAVAVSPITNILELPSSSHDLVPVLSLFATPTMQQLYPILITKTSLPTRAGNDIN
ncbi:MAG: hypothetical protein Q9204_005941 [Flavoplaca sp. TL-2023a]